MTGGILSLADVAQATRAQVHPHLDEATLTSRRVRAVSTDTRTVQPGDLFVALRGPNADGHRFIPDAVARQAAGVIAARLPGGPIDPATPVLLVEDTLRALGAVAARYREDLPAEVVGITGSVGKTTVAALAAAVLERHFRVVRSEESWNAEIGVPLTLLRATPETQVVVMEMAMRGLGQIRELVEMARPRIGVVTNIGEAHMGLLGSMERIAEAKGELVAGLPPDGVAVLNADDPWSGRLASLARCRVVRFGVSPDADVRADWITGGGRSSDFRLATDGEATRIHLPLAGQHNVANALAAAAAGVVLGVPLDGVRAALEQAAPLSKRLQVEEVGDLVILNDTYNASPRSVRAALDVLDAIAGGRRRVAVLGDMKELGAESVRLHREIGREAAGRGVALIVAVGPESTALAQGAREIVPADRIVHFPDREAAIARLHMVIRPGDVVLVKGSRAMGLEAMVEALRAHPVGE